MAGAQDVLPLPYQANEALTLNRFVKLAGDQLVDQADTAGERVLGVCNTSVSAAEATDGKTVAVHVLGVAWVEASAAITRGDRVSTSANGRAKTAASTEVPVGIALTGATAAGELIRVLLAQGLPAV